MNRSVSTTRDEPPAAAGNPARDLPPGIGDALPLTTGLARSGDAEVVTARDHRDRLVHAAVEVVAACGHDPDVARCDDAGCHLTWVIDGAAICQVAHGLARLPDAPPVGGVPSAAEAVAEFRARLVAVADAIRHCRQAEHGSGSCWFTAIPATDGCRDVLRLLHRAC